MLINSYSLEITDGPVGITINETTGCRDNISQVDGKHHKIFYSVQNYTINTQQLSQ